MDRVVAWIWTLRELRTVWVPATITRPRQSRITIQIAEDFIGPLETPMRCPVSQHDVGRPDKDHKTEEEDNHDGPDAVED
jgi:hypothetical protein